VQNFKNLAALDPVLTYDLLFLHVIMREHGVTVKELTKHCERADRWVRGILDADPAPYGSAKRKQGQVFLGWLYEGYGVLDKALTEILDERGVRS